MTEDQAKTKWCPMVRTHISVNRDYYGCETAIGPAVNKLSSLAYCIASGCMMWHVIETLPAYTGGDIVPWIKKHREIFGSTLTEAKAAADSGKPIPGGGYCGLAGKP